MKIGIFAVDPGGETGVARAIINTRHRLTADRMRERSHNQSFTLKGDEIAQCFDLARKYAFFKRMCENQQVKSALVIEDFILRPGDHGGGKEGLSPVRIAWGMLGILEGLGEHQMSATFWQLPSQAAVPSERLRDWDAWIVGREHERSAYQHMGLFAGRLPQNSARPSA